MAPSRMPKRPSGGEPTVSAPKKLRSETEASRSTTSLTPNTHAKQLERPSTRRSSELPVTSTEQSRSRAVRDVSGRFVRHRSPGPTPGARANNQTVPATHEHMIETEIINFTVYGFVRHEPTMPVVCMKSMVTEECVRLRDGEHAISNYDLASRIAPILDLSSGYEGAFRLQVTIEPQYSVEMLLGGMSAEDVVAIMFASSVDITTPTIDRLLSLDDLLVHPIRDVELRNRSLCSRVPQPNDCLLIQFCPVMKPPGGLAISPPSLHTSLPASPSRLIHLKRSSSTEPPSLPSAPIAEAPPSGVDLYRPQGTWREAIGLPPNSVNPVWAFLPAGGGKKKKVPGSGRSLPTSSRKCAGVWMCSSSTCLHIARPIVSSKECLRYCETCRSPMNLISCSARWNVVTLPKIEQGAFAQLVYHEGIHEHVEPPGRGVPSGVSAKVVDLGRQNPSIIPTQSQSGSYSVNSERRQARQPSREVHLSPTTSSNSASPLQQARETSGTPDSDSQSDASEGQNMVALDILAELARANPNTFGGLVIDGGIILMNLQSPKMRERLNSSRAGLETSGRHGRPGLATDAHNTFFNKPYILIQTVMFSDSTSRWLPVLYTVTDRETAEAYERHFTALFEAFDIDFRPEKIAAQFMHADDFSSAQSEGFVTALAQFAEASYTRQRKTGGEVSVQDRNSYYEQGLFEAQRLVKGGCGQFDLDIAQAARQFRIPDSERVEFVQSAYLVVMSNTVAAIQAQRSKMLARWPIMMRWFGWWTASRIARLTGASQTGTSPEDLVAIPSDSNAVEHTNMVVLQMSRGEKLTLEVGLGRLYDLIQAYDAQESAANTVVDSEMKRELAHKLVMFEGEKLQEAINIIRRGQPDALRASNHKLDIDIDILDRRTLVALYRYVCPGIQCGTTLLKVGR